MREDKLIATVTFLNRRQVDYLDKVSKDYFFKYGRKLSRARILSELINLAMELGIKLNEMDFESHHLQGALLERIRNGT